MDAQAFWLVIGRYNQDTVVIQAVLLGLLLLAVIISYHGIASWLAKLALGIGNLFIGFGFFATYGTQPIQTWFALPLFLACGVIFLWEAWKNCGDVPKKPDLFQMLLLLLYLLYPVVSLAFGSEFPQMVTHIMPCPIVSLSIVVYSGYSRKNKVLLALLTVWGLTGIKSVLFHAYEDLILLLCGIYGVSLLVKTRKKREETDMQFHEFGKENSKTLILLHGMCQRWQSVYEQLQGLEEEYRLILPVLTGYSENDRNYVSFADECRQIEEYVCAHHGGKLHGVYGISQGATILSELLARNRIAVKYAVLDGVYVAHQGKLFGIIGAKAIRRIQKNGANPLKGLEWAVKRMGMTVEDMETEISRSYFDFPDEHLEHYFIENYTYHANQDLANSKTMVYLHCGEKEPYAKKSHRILKQYLQNYEEEIFPNMGHSNMLMKHNDLLVKKLRAIFSQP